MAHWYCKKCSAKKEPASVTFEENCSDCGTHVNFINTKRGVLFNKAQGDYYELTGEKPMICAGNVSEGTCGGSMGYVRYLEQIVNPPTKENQDK